MNLLVKCFGESQTPCRCGKTWCHGFTPRDVGSQNLSGPVTARHTLHKFINRAKSNLHFPATLFPENKLMTVAQKKGLLWEWKPKEKWWVKLTSGRAAVKTKTGVMQICVSGW